VVQWLACAASTECLLSDWWLGRRGLTDGFTSSFIIEALIFAFVPYVLSSQQRAALPPALSGPR
jgi:hypothetical protein